VYVSGNDDASLDVFLLFGSLLGHLLDDAIVYVAVQLVNGDVPVAVKIGFPVVNPSTRERMNTDRVPSPMMSFPSKEYWVASDAVRTTRPLPWNFSRACT
jgi:hypothetical protein